MQMSFRSVFLVAGGILVLFLIMVGFMVKSASDYKSQIVQLQNEVASRDKTIEIQKGVYERLAVQSRDLSDLLGDKDRELSLLKERLKEQGASLLAANTLVVKLKKQLDAHQEVPVISDPEKPGIKGVVIDTGSQMDPFQVTGTVYVDCGSDRAIVDLHLTQCRALKISVIVSQDRDGVWRTSATSSDPNFGVDISLSAVNPYIFEPKWYEKIGLALDLGVGTNPGLLAGAGASYRFGKFEVGPKAWVVIDRGVSPYFGAQLLWHPFEK